MITHYLKTAVRSITRRKLYSSISILGLAVGMAVCMLVMTFVNHERSFDSMYPDSERVYRLIRENSDTGARLATFFTAMTPSITRDFPEVESFTRLYNRDSLLTVDNDSYYQSISMVDTSFFDFFPSEIIAGDPTATIADPSSAVVTEAAAEYLFGTTDVVGNVFGLIIASGIVGKQINYALSKPLGYDPENVVIIENLRISGADREFQTMRDELITENSIIAVASSTAIPAGPLGGVLGYSKVGESRDVPYSLRGVQMSPDYFVTLEMDIVEGRVLSDNYSQDRSERSQVDGESRTSSNIVINMAASRALGWDNPEDALNNIIYRGSQYFTIVGVAKDAHFSSLTTEIEPMFFRLDNTRNYMLVKINESETGAALQAIDQAWDRHVPNYPIQRSFLSDLYAAAYSAETRTLSMFTSLSSIAVLISCLGLYPLAAFMAELRTKEIGIRKIVGASVGRITSLLSWDFSKMVLVANLIAWPMVWWLMQKWLSNFAYQTDVNIFIFIVAGISTFSLALATTAQRSYKAVVANPVEALRYE